MKLFATLLKKRFLLVILSFVLILLSICMTLFWNVQVSRMIDKIGKGDTLTSQIVWTGIVTVFLLAMVSMLGQILTGWTNETIGGDLRLSMAKSLSEMPMETIDSLSTGEALSKLQNEAAEAVEYLRNQMLNIVEDGIKFLGTFLWMLYANPSLTLISHVPLLLIFWYVVVSSRIIQTHAEKSQQANTAANQWVVTLITTFPIIRIFGAEENMCRWYGETLTEWGSSSAKEERLCARLMSLSAILRFLPLILLFLVGGTDVINGKISMGMLYIFINLSGNVSGVAANLPRRIAVFRRFTVNLKRLEPFV